MKYVKTLQDMLIRGPNIGGALGFGCMEGKGGYLPIAKLRHILMNYGEPITEEMFNLLKSKLPEDERGMVKIKDLIDLILDPTIKYTSEWLEENKEDFVTEDFEVENLLAKGFI